MALEQKKLHNSYLQIAHSDQHKNLINLFFFLKDWRDSIIYTDCWTDADPQIANNDPTARHCHVI